MLVKTLRKYNNNIMSILLVINYLKPKEIVLYNTKLNLTIWG